MGCGGSKAAAPKQPPASSGSLLGKEQVPADQKSTGEFKVKLGAVFPDFQCETTQGSFRFHEFLVKEGQPAWTVLFAHPKDFTPVSSTELAICSSLVAKFAKKGVKLIGLSCDSVSEHNAWSEDVLAIKNHHTGFLGSLIDKAEDLLGLAGTDLGFPLIADEKREIASLLGMAGQQAGADVPASAHGLFVIAPDKTNRATLLYPMTSGYSFAEVLRLVDSLLLTNDQTVATPGNWRPGDRVVVPPGVETEKAKEQFANLEVKQVPSGEGYLRYVDCPGEPAKQSEQRHPEIRDREDFKLNILVPIPDFDCKTTDGDFKFHEFLDREPKWTVLATYPRDFCPVSTTELSICQGMASQLGDLGVKVIALSPGSVADHQKWSADVLATKEEEGSKLAFPLIADEACEIVAKLGVLDPRERDASGLPLPARALLIIAPDKTIRATMLYPATTGRNFDEVLRILLSLQMGESLKLATPGNWEKGDRLVLPPEMTAEEAQVKFSNLEVKDLPSKKPYLRCVDSPAPAEPSAKEPSPEPEGSQSLQSAAVQEPKLKNLTEVPDSKPVCCC